MKYISRKVFPYLLGAAIGAFAGWAVADYYLKAKDEDTEIVEGDWQPYKGVEGEEEVEEPPIVLKRDKKKKEPKRDYTKFADKGTLDEAVEQFLGNQVEEEDEQEGRGPIYVISLEDYTTNNFEFDHLVLTYYEGDDTLAMDNDEIISDPDSVIGPEGLTSFGNGSEDPDTVYIRNENLGIEYEVIMSHEKYSVAVAGIPEVDPPKPPKPPKRRSSRKKKVEEPEEDSEE